MKDIVIYHTLCGNFDKFKQPSQYYLEYDYVMFTDQPLLIDNYTLYGFEEVFSDPARTAKKPKILPHRYLKDYRISVYIDANFHIKGDIKELINKYKDELFTVFYHPYPNGKQRTIGQELKECKLAKLDDELIMQSQVNHYLAEGYKKEYPFNACGFMMRHHNDHRVIAFMEDWWKEICTWSKRDQLSFPFVLWKHKFPLTYADTHMYRNPYWVKFEHNWKMKRGKQ